jgi:hypothetical protein
MKLARAVLLATLAAPALAAAPATELLPGGVVTVLPSGDVVADGLTKAHLHVLALRGDGSPHADLDVKLKASSGEISAWTSIGNGLYAFDYQPAVADAPRTDWLEIKGKTSDKVKIDVRAPVTVRPPPRGLLRVEAPARVVVGKDESATIKLLLEGNVEFDPKSVDVRVSSGELGELVRMGAGEILVKWTPPKVKAPEIALVTVAHRADPGRVYASAAIAVAVEAEQKVTAAANAQVLVRVAGEDFGPVAADAKGRATIKLIRAPGLDAATLVTVVGGQTTEAPLALPSTGGRRIQLVPSLPGIPGDPGVGVTLRASVRTPTGKPDTDAKVVFTATRGAFGEARHEGDGIYAADYTPEVAPASAPITVTAAIDGEKTQQDAVPFTLVASRPGGMSVDAAPTGSAWAMTVKLEGPNGGALVGRPVAVDVTGGKLDAPLADRKDGSYAGTVTAYAKNPVQLLTTATPSASPNPVYRVVVLPADPRLPNDGISSTPLTLLAVDRYGYPVAGAEIALLVDAGGGKLPATITTDANGLGRAFYTTSREPALVRLRATTQGRTAATALWQVPIDAPAMPTLPRSGDPEAVAWQGAWESLVRRSLLAP